MRSLLSIIIVAAAALAGAPTLHAQDSSNVAATPQGKIVLAYYKAIQAGDLAALKKTLTDESAKELDGAHGKEIFGMLKEMTPAGTPALSKLNVTGKTATLDAQMTEKPGATTTEHMKLVLVGTDWKVNTTGK